MREEICPVCRKRAYVSGVQLDHVENQVTLWVYYFCDRTKGCEAHEFDPYSEQLVRVGTHPIGGSGGVGSKFSKDDIVSVDSPGEPIR